MSAGVTLAVMIVAFRLFTLNADSGTWVLAAAIGQYKRTGIPLISGRSGIEVIWIVAPMVVAWFNLSTYMAKVY